MGNHSRRTKGKFRRKLRRSGGTRHGYSPNRFSARNVGILLFRFAGRYRHPWAANLPGTGLRFSFGREIRREIRQASAAAIPALEARDQYRQVMFPMAASQITTAEDPPTAAAILASLARHRRGMFPMEISQATRMAVRAMASPTLAWRAQCPRDMSPMEVRNPTAAALGQRWNAR